MVLILGVSTVWNLIPMTQQSANLHAFLYKLQKESDRSRLVSVPERSHRAMWKGMGLIIIY